MGPSILCSITYLFITLCISTIASSPLKKGGGVEDFGSSEIGGGFALISGF